MYKKLVVGVCLAITSVAFVSGQAPRTGPTAAKAVQGAATPTPAPTSAPAATGASPLIGDNAIEASNDSNPAGMAEAFLFTASSSGTASRLWAYLDGASTANQVTVGIYSHDPSTNSPGTLLAQNTMTAPVNGAWNVVAIPATTITAGTSYWIAVLGPAAQGTIQFRDHSTGGRNITSAQTTLATLPATWSNGTVYANAPVSAYASP